MLKLIKGSLISNNPEEEEVISMWVDFHQLVYIEEDDVLVDMSDGGLPLISYEGGLA
jgi:hypothetical protein